MEGRAAGTTRGPQAGPRLPLGSPGSAFLPPQLIRTQEGNPSRDSKWLSVLGVLYHEQGTNNDCPFIAGNIVSRTRNSPARQRQEDKEGGRPARAAGASPLVCTGGWEGALAEPCCPFEACEQVREAGARDLLLRSLPQATPTAGCPSGHVGSGSRHPLGGTLPHPVGSGYGHRQSALCQDLITSCVCIRAPLKAVYTHRSPY